MQVKQRKMGGRQTGKDGVTDVPQVDVQTTDLLGELKSFSVKHKLIKLARYCF